MQVIWGQRVRQLGINHTRSALRCSGVEYHVKVPQLLVVGGTEQYFTKHGGDQYRYLQPDYSGRQTLWQVFTRILQAAQIDGGFQYIHLRQHDLAPQKTAHTDADGDSLCAEHQITVSPFRVLQAQSVYLRSGIPRPQMNFQIPVNMTLSARFSP
jgi:hypothetical protein